MTFVTSGRAQTLSTIADGVVLLSRARAIVDGQLVGLAKQFPTVNVDCYVIIPNHVHAVFVIADDSADSPNPSLPDVVRWLKSTTSMELVRRAKAVGQRLGMSGSRGITTISSETMRNWNGFVHMLKRTH